jgi:gamma-glutamyltranspeptidase/glutathione hydrolase
MGGDSQPQVLLQLLHRLLVLGESPAHALAAPRWTLAGAGGGGFETWTDEAQVVRLEGHAPEAWADGLRARGHEVTSLGDFDHAFGHAHVVVDGGDVLAGAADPRARVGAAAGY